MNDDPTLLKESWVAFLDRWQWDSFLTITFREPRKAGHAESTLRQLEKYLLRRRATEALFLGAEKHKQGTLHVHGLGKWFNPQRDTTILRKSPGGFYRHESLLWADLYRDFGRADIRLIEEVGGVLGYCTKYCTKGLTDYRIMDNVRNRC